MGSPRLMASARRNWLSAIGPQDEADDDRRDRKIEPAHQKAQRAIALDHIAERSHAHKFENDD
jgi:hypothetical protein